MIPTTGDWVFLGIALLWCGLWAFVWFRAARGGRQLSAGAGRRFLVSLQMGVFYWSNANLYIREHYPLMKYVAFLGWMYLGWPELRVSLREIFADDKQKAGVSR